MGHTEERKTPKPIEDARPAVQPVVMAWVPVSERMPEPGRVVLAAYQNALGMSRRVRATWEDGMCECACEGECGAHDDGEESHMIPEGWYECCDQAEEHYRIHETVTHWRPLPAINERIDVVLNAEVEVGMRLEKTVVVFKQEKYDGEWPPTAAVECIAWFAEKLATIPEAYRTTATIEIDSVGGEESHYGRIEISYTRPETDKEMNAREAQQLRNAEAIKARELAALATLKAKYDL